MSDKNKRYTLVFGPKTRKYVAWLKDHFGTSTVGVFRYAIDIVYQIALHVAKGYRVELVRKDERIPVLFVGLESVEYELGEEDLHPPSEGDPSKVELPVSSMEATSQC